MAATVLLRLLLLACLFLAGSFAENKNTTITTPCPQYRCGQSVVIRYPFWVDDGDDHDASGSAVACGYPRLRLECRLDTPVLKLPSGDYAVTRILYGDRTLTVFDLAVNSSTCPHELAGRNLTLPPGSPPPLSLTEHNTNLTFFVKCSFAGVSTDHIVPPCLQDGASSSYFFRNSSVPFEYAALCEDVVGLPVLKLNPVEDVVTALKAGFELRWRSAVAGECAECEKAGGLCGQRGDTAHGPPTFACFHKSAATPPARHSARWAAAWIITITVSVTAVVLGILACLLWIGVSKLLSTRQAWQGHAAQDRSMVIEDST